MTLTHLGIIVDVPARHAAPVDLIHESPVDPAAPPALARGDSRSRTFASSVAWAMVGFGVFAALWQVATIFADKLPTPWETFTTIRTMAADPFYDT